MRTCERCFAAGTWIPNASPPDAAPANCDFGHGYAHRTWPTTAWIDSLLRLFAIYEEEIDPAKGRELHVQIQEDWRIFSFTEPELTFRFLTSVFKSDPHPLLLTDVKVRLRIGAGGGSPDHISSWAQFSREIRTRNRYFPQAVPDRKILERVLLESAEAVKQDICLYRGRVMNSRAVPAVAEMGAPPAEKASAGRANPVGIPYLYLAYSVDTCFYETRVANHTYVAVGKFYARRDLVVLNLADIDAPDFFSVEEIESDEEQIARVAFHRYLTALGNELRKPVRSTDQPTDYIPTQYLCELAKSLGLDGVLYASSLDPSGRNLVLFDVESASCTEVKLLEVTSVLAEWRQVT